MSSAVRRGLTMITRCSSSATHCSSAAARLQFPALARRQLGCSFPHSLSAAVSRTRSTSLHAVTSTLQKPVSVISAPIMHTTKMSNINNINNIITTPQRKGVQGTSMSTAINHHTFETNANVAPGAKAEWNKGFLDFVASMEVR
eukprot:3074088-Rhodomonas_salina.3